MSCCEAAVACGSAGGAVAVAWAKPPTCASARIRTMLATRADFEEVKKQRFKECMTPDYSWCFPAMRIPPWKTCTASERQRHSRGCASSRSSRRNSTHDDRPPGGAGVAATYLCVVGGVLIDELSLFGRNFVIGEDRVGRTDRHASAAVDTSVRVNVKLGLGLELLLVLLGVDAIGRASFHAEFVFGAGISDGVRHDCCISSILCACRPHRQQSRRFVRQHHCTKLANRGSVTAVTE